MFAPLPKFWMQWAAVTMIPRRMTLAVQKAVPAPIWNVNLPTARYGYVVVRRLTAGAEANPLPSWTRVVV